MNPKDDRIIAVLFADMSGLGGTELLVLLSVAVLLFGGKRLPEIAAKLAEGISNFRGGGPASPSHPLPGDDSAILNRRRRPQNDPDDSSPR